MTRQIGVLLMFALVSFACSGRKAYGEENPGMKINRVDQVLYKCLTQNLPDDSLQNFKPFLDVLGKEIIFIGSTDSIGYYDRLRTYFSDPTLMGLYRDEQQQFSDISLTEKELDAGFSVLLDAFPQLKRPELYMHVSGLNQSVIVTDDLLSLSADKYLGKDYPLYQDHFYDYQLQQMTPDRIVPDYLLGFMLANFSFKGNEDVLLDKMLHEGRIRYILSRLIPERQIWEYVGYTKDQYLWCSDNQSRIWKSILEQQHLYTPDYLITAQYLKDAPSTTFLPKESPGRVGVWLGYQIIIAYMKQHPDTSLSELMNLTDYQEMLKQSKYKP